MKTPLVLVSGVVLGIAIGVVVGRTAFGGGKGLLPDGSTSADGQRVSSRTMSGGQRPDSGADSVLSALLKGRSPSDLTADEAYHLIQPHLEVDEYKDPLEKARSSYQFQLLMSRLPLPVLEELMAKCGENGEKGVSIGRIFSNYSARDWDKAMAWASGQPNERYLQSTAIARLAHEDPARAAELFGKNLQDGADQSDSWDVMMNLSAATARQGPEMFLKLMDDMPTSTLNNMMSNGARNIPKEQIPAFIEQLSQRVEAGTMHKSTLSMVMSGISGTHPEEAQKWLATQEPGQERSQAELLLVRRFLYYGKTAEAEAAMTSAMAGMAGKEKEFVKQSVRDIVSSSPQLADKLLAFLPEDEKLTPADAKGWGNYYSSRPDKMVDVARLFKTQEERADYLVESFTDFERTMNANDFKILAHRVETLGLTDDAAAKTQDALETLKARQVRGQKSE